MIHGHGNNLLAYGKNIRLDFSSNIAFNNHCDHILAYLQSQLQSIKNYPDPAATHLTQKLALHHAITPENVLVTNGSAEAFYLVAHFLAKSTTAICIPAFAEYEDACALHEHKLDFVDIQTFPHLDYAPYKSVWLGNPNNPDGVITPPEVILEQCRRQPETFFIIDQAYVQLTGENNVDVLPHCPQASQICQGEAMTQASPPQIPHTANSTISLPDNLIVIHSLTKEFGIPGLRLGYITASVKVITALSQMRPPWSVNALALAVGEFTLDNYTALLPDKGELLGESLFLQEALAKIQGITVLPSPCNFFLSRLAQGTAAKLKQRLIDDYGILIRDASNFKSLTARHFRVAPQKHEDNLALIHAMKTILA